MIANNFQDMLFYQLIKNTSMYIFDQETGKNTVLDHNLPIENLFIDTNFCFLKSPTIEK